MYSNLNTDEYRNRQLRSYLKEFDEPIIIKKKGDVFMNGEWYNRGWHGKKIIFKPVKK